MSKKIRRFKCGPANVMGCWGGGVETFEIHPNGNQYAVFKDRHKQKRNTPYTASDVEYFLKEKLWTEIKYFPRKFRPEKVADDSRHASGVCPSCGYGLEYPSPITLTFDGDGGYVKSSCPKCGYKGRENYNLEFVRHT